MSNSTSSKGGSHLASVIQERIAAVKAKNGSVYAEIGKMVANDKLKLSSIPGIILDRTDYSVCASIEAQLNVGIKVLVIWTYDGEPVIVDKLT